jgi:hypothetical protein
MTGAGNCDITLLSTSIGATEGNEIFDNGGGGTHAVTKRPGVGTTLTKAADFTADNWNDSYINNKPDSACVVTLPAAALFPGREISFLNHQAQAVNSASSNIVPKMGGEAGTAIVGNTAGLWTVIKSIAGVWTVVRAG